MPRTVTSVFAAAAALFILAAKLFATPAEAPDPPYSYVLMEGSTATLLYEENGNAPVPAHHSAKLMTLLLAMEKISAGELKFSDILKTSPHANSMQGAQIWLMPGEEISVEELVKAVTIGSANDACVVLAEAVGGTEDGFVGLMNKKAGELGMLGTRYEDCTGISRGSVTTACDCAVLASELLKYPELTPYFTTWVDSVRGGKTEVASENRLLLTYSGITGMKAYYSKDTGNCLIAAAERDGLKMVCVIFGEKDGDQRFKTAKEKLNAGFSAYTVYQPKASDIYTEPVGVSGGEKTEAACGVREFPGFIIRKSAAGKIESETVYSAEIKAPVEIGDEVGRVIYKIDGEEVFSLKIEALEEVRKLGFFTALRRILRFAVEM